MLYNFIMDLGKRYDFKKIETKWLDKGINTTVDSTTKFGKTYSIIMPPPNITGMLHMGHVLNITLQDVLTRKAANNSKDVFWLPGLDHAAIATEVKVVDSLKKQGIRKKDLSRDEFLKCCWEWKDKYGSTILNQMKRLGVSCNWDRLRFTLDDKSSKYVIDTFIKLYNDGYLYRAEKMINWDPKFQTALSDEEVVYHDADGILYFLKYKIVDSNDFLIVATSRPETVFGDVAVCVNPNDDRYKKLIGKKVIVPIVGREVPVIADEYVDKEFGTGCLKITPAHDFNDYNIGEKHDLKKINILYPNGKLNENCRNLNGIDRFEARKIVVQRLSENELLFKEEKYQTRIGYSERSNTIVEPRLSRQWFIKMSTLAKPALQAVIDGKIEFHPDKFVNIYRSWLENVQDWCISRQLWWGHRIPVYYFNDRHVAAHDINEAFHIFSKDNKSVRIEDIKQDEDVLDTWFSAALWPEITTYDVCDLPTDDLVTGPDIIFFWVARMVMMSCYLYNTIPFKNVYFTGIIRDKIGRKMSKSLGNSPDPLDLIDKYGADAVRFGILLSSQAGNDLQFDEQLCVQGRNFSTKIWNAFRLINMWKDRIGDIQISDKEINAINDFKEKLGDAQTDVESKFKQYRINEAAMIIYKLVWDDFCSTYLERIKPTFDDDISRDVVDSSSLFLRELMKMLNPFMPFITSEILNS